MLASRRGACSSLMLRPRICLKHHHPPYLLTLLYCLLQPKLSARDSLPFISHPSNFYRKLCRIAIESLPRRDYAVAFSI